ncbi:MAG TPA: DUF4260 domain-containing protein [Candidatus Polarisedimenticolaceae bacterium]|nr:DUF4260 domain-containing protein [Candidatus Polarisedimenticolaceae bacterium]
MRNLPVWFQRAEGAMIFFGITVLYTAIHGNLWLYLLVFLSIDLSILGYLGGPRAGAIVYNTFHSFTLPILCVAIGLLSYEIVWLSSVGLVWMAHIGIDRTLGLGLKFPDGFKHTHLGKIGWPKH